MHAIKTVCAALMLAALAGVAGASTNAPVVEDPITHGEFLRALMHESQTCITDYQEAGGDINQPDPHTGMTALHMAVRYNRHITALALLDAGAEVNARNKIGAAPLHLAAAQGNPIIVLLLLRNGAEVNARDRDGFTPLHLAAQYDHPAMVELLTDWGADLNARTNDRGLTPLHWAAFLGQVETVKALLDSGANIFAMDNEGRTPYKWASNSPQGRAARLLARRGGHWQ